MEVVVKQVRTTRRPWLIACDANMCPEDFKKRAVGSQADTCSLWRQEREFQLADPKSRMESLSIGHRQSQPSGKSQEYGGGGRLRIKTTQGGHFLGRKTQRVPGMASAKNAKSFARIQCWKAARTKQSGRMKRRIKRGGRSNVGERADECDPGWREPRETDAAEGGVTRKAASVVQSTQAREEVRWREECVDFFSESELGVGQKGWLDGAASGLKP